VKLPKYPIWGKVHIAPSGGRTLCGTIERNKTLRVESGDYIQNLKRFCKKKNVCKSCSKFLKV
jgi:hypothetical protein